MRIVHIKQNGKAVLAARRGDELIDLNKISPGPGTNLVDILAGGKLAGLADKVASAGADAVVSGSYTYLSPVEQPGKIICVGLNYADHAKESPYDRPDYPVLFLRVATSLVPHGEPLIAPKCSEQFDYEGEMVAIIGKGGRHIARDKALEHVAGYSVFNEGSVRDYQFKSPQWTSGKNFDGSGGFGPDFVTADELPPGGKGLKIVTRLNGETVQEANTDDMLFPVDEIIAVASEVMTLEAGDVLVLGTPAGVGAFRKPPLWMKDGDVCEVEVEKICCLSNPVKAEA
jgi:2-keto-4-pentenoate hydratase/2-oxohepta-3-ene-1,7-dioic acid hydratase in catechol pathway